MRKSKAIQRAKDMKTKIGHNCYVIKLRVKFVWYKPYTWLPTYENVSQHYIDKHTDGCKTYYKTK